jgi:hypothetical protein
VSLARGALTVTGRRAFEPEAQAAFFRRRHQPRRPPLAKIRPGRPAPAMGPGTLTPVSEKAACRVALCRATNVKWLTHAWASVLFSLPRKT